MGDRRVAVIDGDPAVRDSLATLMEINGYQVVTYSTGRAFLRDQAGQSADCIICEADLPDTTGMEVYRALSATHPNTRFALLVSRQQSGTISSARKLGIQDIFSKPLVHRRLVRFVGAS